MVTVNTTYIKSKMSDKNIHFTKTVKYFILNFKTPARLPYLLIQSF